MKISKYFIVKVNITTITKMNKLHLKILFLIVFKHEI